MGYDPCFPHSPVAAVVKAGHRLRHHPVHRLIGRRIAHWHGVGVATDACPKTARTLPLPIRVAKVLDPIASPGVLTVAAMGVVGATAFGGLTLAGPSSAPVSVQPPGHVPVQPTPMTSGKGTPGTAVPEPGTAALLALAMVVVLISSWVQGGRALKARAPSDIAAGPLPKKRSVPATLTHAVQIDQNDAQSSSH